MERITLNNGVNMPILGFGTYQIKEPAECIRCVSAALRAGYRLIDTAQAYGNEEAVGAGIRASGVPREEIFVTTKLWFRAYESGVARAAMQESFNKLGVDHLDMVLLHWPFGNTYAAWRELEKLHKEGRIRAIGVSNYAPSQLIDLMEFNEIRPAVNQIETHLLAQQQELHALMAERGVAHQAYAPFAQGRGERMFEAPAVTTAARAHGKTAHQVALRFLIQQGIAAIPKSAGEERIRENFDIFDFALTDGEMEVLRAMDTNRPFIGNSQDAETAAFAMTW